MTHSPTNVSPAPAIALPSLRPGVSALRLRRSALLEMVLFFAAALGIDYFAFGGTRFYGMAEHPFWMIVILVSVTYGINEGLLAAALSSVALLAGNLPAQGIDQDVYAYAYGIAERPLLWLLAAVVVGGMRQRQLRERAALRVELARTREERDVVADSYGRLKVAKEQMEIAAAAQRRTVAATYAAGRALDQPCRAQVVAGAAELVRAVLNADRFSLFLVNDDALALALAQGWQADAPLERVFASRSRLFDHVVRRRRSLVATRSGDREVLAGQGLLAGPLVAPGSGAVLGMLKVEGMPFQEFDAATIGSFQLLCDWIAAAIDRAGRFEAARAASLMDFDTGLMSAAAFQRLSACLVGLGRRVGFEVWVAQVAVEGLAEADAAERRRAVAALAETAQDALAALAFAGDGRDKFRLLIPHGGETVEPAVRRVVDALRDAWSDPDHPQVVTARILSLTQAKA